MHLAKWEDVGHVRMRACADPCAEVVVSRVRGFASVFKQAAINVLLAPGDSMFIEDSDEGVECK